MEVAGANVDTRNMSAMVAAVGVHTFFTSFTMQLRNCFLAMQGSWAGYTARHLSWMTSSSGLSQQAISERNSSVQIRLIPKFKISFSKVTLVRPLMHVVINPFTHVLAISRFMHMSAFNVGSVATNFRLMLALLFNSISGIMHAVTSHPVATPGMPETALGKPETALGMPETALGKPETALGKPETALGMPETALGKPDTAPGRPAIVLGYMLAALGMPDIENREAGLGYLDQGADIILGFLNIGLRYADMELGYRLKGLTEP